MKIVSFVALVAALIAISLVGCKSVPTADVVRTGARAGGVATGLALGYCDIDAEAGEVITNIVGNLGACVPKDGETLQDAWIRTAQTHTEILVARGELTAQQAAMVVAGVRIVVKGYDLLILWKPEIETYTDLTVAAIDGFSDGFLATYKPQDKTTASCILTADPMAARFFGDIIQCREYKMMKRK